MHSTALPADMTPTTPTGLPLRAQAPASQALQRPAAATRLATVTLGLALLFLAWEASGGDLWLAQQAGGAHGFALREHWLLTQVLHSGGRWLAWMLALGLSLGVWWPLGPLQHLAMAQRLQLAGGVLLCVAMVSLLKAISPAACPWSLVQFGGVAQPVSHWLVWVQPVGGRGGCFPAGHASAGFAFVGGWFVFRPVNAALARRWLGVAVVAGGVLGVSQQWRGAHFMSHTLWSGWLCWCLAWAIDTAVRRFGATGGTSGDTPGTAPGGAA